MRATNTLPLLQQYKVLFQYYKRLILIGCGLMVCQQISGIVIANQYGPVLIEDAGFKTEDVSDEIAAVILSLPLSFVRLLGTIIAITVIDAKGRRTVLMYTLPILAGVMIMLGAAFACYQKSDEIWLKTIGKWSSLLLMIAFLFTYSAGLASIPWLINSEIYPLFLIGSASALAAFVNWLTSFAYTSIFQETNFIASLEVAGVCNIFTYLFVFYFLKETKGNSITKNIALMLNKSQREVTQFV